MTTTPDATIWHDARTLTIEGRGWDDTAEFYNRFPDRAQSRVPEGVWDLSQNTSGMLVRFVTDSSELSARWTLTNSNLALDHMPATGVSGVDLYVRHEDGWRWLAVGRTLSMENEAKLIADLSPEKREYALYLPLYNGVQSLEIGITQSAVIEAAPPRRENALPVVFYGSSITQGGCASRPGRAYPAIVGRRLDIPTVNLGFSGSARCEPEVADLLAELDPAVYVIDCMPNMDVNDVDERIRYLLRALKEKRPTRPVVLVEEAALQSAFIRPDVPNTPKNLILEKIYKDSLPDWGDKLSYVKGSALMGIDGESTVDGIHPNDLGFQRMADALTPAVKAALSRK